MDYDEEVNQILRTDKIVRRVGIERHRAALKGYDLQHDLDHGGPDHMIAYAHQYLQKAKTPLGGPVPDRRRENLVKAAGLIVAAIDAHDHLEIQRQDEAIERGG